MNTIALIITGLLILAVIVGGWYLKGRSSSGNGTGSFGNNDDGLGNNRNNKIQN